MSGGGPTPSTWAGAAQSRRLTGAAQSRRRFWGVSWTEAGGVCRGGASRRLRASATRLVRACTGPSSDTGPSRSRLQGPATVKTAAAPAAVDLYSFLGPYMNSCSDRQDCSCGCSSASRPRDRAGSGLPRRQAQGPAPHDGSIFWFRRQGARPSRRRQGAGHFMIALH